MHELSNLIKDYGGYAGAFSVLGLAVLSLLYFAQAREVKRLREWAGRAPERDAELQARVTADAARRQTAGVQRQPVPPQRAPGQPQTAAAQARPAGANGQGGQPGAVPAGATAAGAAAAATTPGAPAAPGQAAQAGEGAGDTTQVAKPGDGATQGAAAAAAGGAAPATAAAAGGGTAAPPAPGQSGAATPGQSAPATPGQAGPPSTPPPGPAGATAGSASGAPGAPIPPRTAAARPRPSTPPPRQPAAALRQSGAGARTSRPASVQTHRAPRRVPVVALAIAAGVIVLGVVLALVLTGGGDSGTPRATPANTVKAPAGSTQPGASATAERPRSSTTVAVLNGTLTTGLAKRTADRIRAKGYAMGNIADAPEQNRSATLVQFAPGARGEALAVAKVIGVGADAVSQLDVNTKTVAGDNARVVVTVGADQNQNQPPTGQG